MKTVKIDRSKHLNQEPATGHNRWHPDLPPIMEVEPGEEVTLETRYAGDGYLTPRSTEADFATLPTGAIHPLTGPVLVKGASPGDLLEVEFLDIIPEGWGFSCILPGLGFLRDVYTTPFMVHWNIAGGWATSPQISGVRIPGAPFMGLSGVAPSRQQLEAWTRRGLTWLPGAGWSCRLTHRMPCLPPAPWQRTASAPSRPGKTAATSM
jgi:formamidase